jgi:hypothetical protein
MITASASVMFLPFLSTISTVTATVKGSFRLSSSCALRMPAVGLKSIVLELLV